ncbi:hypothetical protein OC845_005044 [Tilletia horrida]|nr:hypothetical protein OC845_005044 [Tilletia horrida]
MSLRTPSATSSSSLVRIEEDVPLKSVEASPFDSPADESDMSNASSLPGSLALRRTPTADTATEMLKVEPAAQNESLQRIVSAGELYVPSDFSPSRLPRQIRRSPSLGKRAFAREVAAASENVSHLTRAKRAASQLPPYRRHVAAVSTSNGNSMSSAVFNLGPVPCERAAEQVPLLPTTLNKPPAQLQRPGLDPIKLYDAFPRSDSVPPRSPVSMINLDSPPLPPPPSLTTAALAATRVWPQDRLTLQLQWPTKIRGVNQARTSGRSSKAATLPRSSEDSDIGRHGGSLVYYRRYDPSTEQDGNRFVRKSGERSQSQDPYKFPTPNLQAFADQRRKLQDEVPFSTMCAQPAWMSDSRRYEAPIRVMIRKSIDSAVWEAYPRAPVGKKRRKGEDWVLRHVETGFKTRVCQEDINNEEFSVTGREGYTWLFRSSSTESVLAVAEKTRPIRCATFDCSKHQLAIDLRAIRTSFRLPPQIDIAFLICFFEAVQAIQDELSSGGKGRRDECGRLINKGGGLKQLLERMMNLA